MISNIAYAMKLFQRRSASATLEAKLARLESLPPSPLIAVDEDAELMTPPNNRISSVVKARVWRIMQKKLYKPEAARRLKPIQPKDGIILLQEPDEMLDESSAPSLETDFESLFEDEDNYILFADLDPEKPGQYSEDDDILREYDDPDDGMLDNGEDLEDWRWRHEEMLEHDCSGDEDMEDLEMLTNVESTYGHDHADQQLPLPYRHPVHNEGANTSPGPEDDDMLFTADHVPYVNETLSSNDPLPHNRGPSTPPSTEDEDLLFLDESRTNNEKVLEGDDDDDLLFEQERCFHALCWDARKDDRNKDDDDEEMMLM